jgi:autotransporter-associated beta strand protein
VLLEKSHRGLFAFILAALISTSSYNAQAVTFLWNNTGTQWTSPTSWTNGVAPTLTSSSATTDEVQFGNFGANFNTVDLTSNRAVKTFTFLNGANAYTVGTTSAKILEISGGLTNNSTATQTFNLVVNNANNSNTWTQVTGGALVFNNTVNLTTASSSTSRILTLAGGGNFTFNAALNQGGTATGGKVVINNAGGVVNLKSANAMGGVTGGMTITSGQVNVSNAQSLGTGIVELGAVTGSAYGGSILNNASGSAMVLTGLTAVTWSGSTTSGNTGIQFGTSDSTSANNMDFGAAVVTASTDRSMNIAGTGVTISMGTLTTSGTAGSYEYRIDGAGNTLDLDGWRLSGAATPIQAQNHKIRASANVNIGAIENGTGGGVYANGVSFNIDGVTRLTGNNTYTGTTEFVGGGTNIISGNNSAAVGNVTIAGVSGSGKKPVVRLDNVNGISSSSSLLGSSSSSQIGTLELKAAGDFSLNSIGTASSAGNNMIFTNSSGSQKTLAFTAANNYITTGSTGGRTLYNNSADLLLDFDGNIEIGGASAGGEATSFAGVGNFNVDGNLLDTGTGLTRILRKQGDGTLTLRGSANNIRGSTLVEAGTLDLYGNLTASTSIVVSTSGTSANSGVRTANATINVREDASLLSSSTTTVWSRGNLIVDGTAGAVVLEDNGLLGGSGAVGSVNLKRGAVLNPGNSPGLLTASEAIWAAGSTYNWEIDQASGGTAGVNWDVFSVVNALDLSALSSSAKMNLVLNSLASMDDFNPNSAYSWVFAQAGSFTGTGLTDGTNVTDLFNITAGTFAGDVLPTTGFKVEVGTDSVSNLRTLSLTTIPEPSTGSMLGLGFAGLVVTRLLRRKNS